MFTQTLESLFANKKVLIVGAAREGISTLEFLRKHLPQLKIAITDEKLDLAQKIATKHKIEAISTQEISNNFDVVFRSPGVPIETLHQKYQVSDKTEINSNTKLFFELINKEESSGNTALPQPLIIGVTGTKGKSTTTSQIHHVLKTAGKNALLGGNIGLPPLRLLENISTPQELAATIFVLELSCHQLSDLTYSPHISVVQEISPDHLDYYPTFEEYLEAKTPIARHQTSNDIIIFNQDSPTATQIAQLSPAQKNPFSLKDEEAVAFIKNSESPLLGKHNIYNTLPSVMIARLLGASEEQISAGLASFTPVPHRLELIRQIDDVKYYNDSAACAPAATEAALKAFEQNSLVLLIGGSDKEVSFDHLAKQLVQANIKFIVFFPVTGQQILDALLKIKPELTQDKDYKFAANMAEAVKIAQHHAKPGDTVLLSPACASFGMFENYADRGDQFRNGVLKISPKKTK